MDKTYKKIKVKNKSLKNKINFVTNFIFENNNKFYNGLYKKDKNLKDSFIHLLLYNKNYRKKRKILLIPHSVRYYNNFNSLLVFEDLKSIFSSLQVHKDPYIPVLVDDKIHEKKNVLYEELSNNPMSDHHPIITEFVLPNINSKLSGGKRKSKKFTKRRRATKRRRPTKRRRAGKSSRTR